MVTYPIKHTLQMVRVQAADEKEYLSSFQEWFAIDKLGNELNDTLRAPETWDNYTFIRNYMPKDRNNPDGPKEPKVTGIKSITHEYTMPFTTENADKLYEMRRTKAPGSVSLSMSIETYINLTNIFLSLLKKGKIDIFHLMRLYIR